MRIDIDRPARALLDVAARYVNLDHALGRERRERVGDRTTGRHFVGNEMPHVQEQCAIGPFGKLTEEREHIHTPGHEGNGGRFHGYRNGYRRLYFADAVDRTVERGTIEHGRKKPAELT